jgi:hypothetical protein
MIDSLRWFKFHPADYENDVALMGCSLQAQGLWMRLLCYMHRAVPYGHLVVNGKPASLRQVSDIVRQRESAVRPLLEELLVAGVMSRNEDRVIYSRRLVREEDARRDGAKHGRKGGNPALMAARTAASKPATGRLKRRDNPTLTNAVFARAKGCCEDCQTPRWINDSLPPKTFLVRRVDPDGPRTPENFIGLCRPCHSKRNLEGGSSPLSPLSRKGGFSREEKRREEKKGTDANASVVDAYAPTSVGRDRSVVPFPKREAAEEQAAFDAWNAMALSSNVRGARTLDADRRVKLRARLHEAGGLDGWMIAVEKVRASSLWQGKVGNGWVGGFDDILGKAKFRKLMEGGYDDRPVPERAAPAAKESFADRMRREDAERIAREAEEERTIEATAS